MKTFVAMALGVLVAFSPLAAMAQSAHAGGGGSHSRHMRHSRNAHKERAHAGAEHARQARHAPITDRRASIDALGAGEGPTERAALTAPERGYFTGQGFTPQISCAYCPIVRSLENLPEPARFRTTFSVHSFGLR